MAAVPTHLAALTSAVCSSATSAVVLKRWRKSMCW